MTILSGRKQSSTATPSFRNSGFEAISIFTSIERCDMMSSISSLTLKAVPTGTVDLMTIMLSLEMLSAMFRAAEKI